MGGHEMGKRAATSHSPPARASSTIHPQGPGKQDPLRGVLRTARVRPCSPPTVRPQSGGSSSANPAGRRQPPRRAKYQTASLKGAGLASPDPSAPTSGRRRPGHRWNVNRPQWATVPQAVRLGGKLNVKFEWTGRQREPDLCGPAGPRREVVAELAGRARVRRLTTNNDRVGLFTLKRPGRARRPPARAPDKPQRLLSESSFSSRRP